MIPEKSQSETLSNKELTKNTKLSDAELDKVAGGTTCNQPNVTYIPPEKLDSLFSTIR